MSSIVVDSLYFINPIAGNFHLGPNSPVIDLCQDTPKLNPLDMDNEPWVGDDSENTNGAGTFDAGADESHVNDMIFTGELNDN